MAGMIVGTCLLSVQAKTYFTPKQAEKVCFPHADHFVWKTHRYSMEDIRAIYEFERSYIREAADAPDGPVLAFCAVHWPNNGPALLGMTFAYNARHRKDPTTGDALFYRMWTEQEYGEVQTKEQMQQDLARYCLAHTPGPKAVV